MPSASENFSLCWLGVEFLAFSTDFCCVWFVGKKSFAVKKRPGYDGLMFKKSRKASAMSRRGDRPEIIASVEVFLVFYLMD